MIKLVNPPQTNSLDDKIDPPLGLMYIAAVLEENGYTVEIVDLAFVPRSKWKDAIGQPDVVGITVMSASLYEAKKILHLIKRNSRKTVVVAGGPHPSCLPEDTLREGFDAVIAGEAEYTFLKLIKSIQYGIFDKITISPLVNVDKLPFPARHLVDLKAYTRKVDGIPATSIITSRGCPYHCAFCDKSVHGNGVRFRSISSVIEEIAQIIENYGIRGFKFDDDTFTINRKRLYLLLDRLQDFNIRFRCQGNARTDTYEDFAKLYKAGCRLIIFGIESGSQLVLDSINKQVTVEQNEQAIINAKKAGLIVRANLMIGNPGESWRTIDETIQFMWRAKPQQWIVSNFIPFPGCPISKNPTKYGITILVNDWKQYFPVADQNIGGLTHRTKHMSMKEIATARRHLIKNLPPQKGPMEDYYAKLEA